MPKRSWPPGAGAATQRSAQRAVRSTARSTLGARRAAGRALVERHGDVRAERGLHGHRELRREARHRAVVDRAERDAVGVDAARVGSEKTWKPPESVRIGASQPMNRCRPPSSAISSSPGPEVQVVGVAEHDLRAELLELARVDAP